jgi:hypothetical protein
VRRLGEGVDDRQLLIDDQAILHIFGVDGGGAGGEGTGDDEAIPVGDAVSRSEIGGEAQQGTIEFDDLTALVEGIDQGLDLRFGKGGFFDQVDADFVDDLGADDDAGGID